MLYCIAQNFGGRKLWRIWRFATDSPKFYPPKTFILAILLCKAANPPMFCLPKCLFAAIRQSFVSYGIQKCSFCLLILQLLFGPYNVHTSVELALQLYALV